jgi:hypothetical protein
MQLSACWLGLAEAARAGAEKTAPPAKQVRYAEVKSLSLKKTFATKSDWHVTAYQSPGEDNASDPEGAPCKISFWKDPHHKQDNCTEIKYAFPDGRCIFNLQSVDDLSIVKLKPDMYGVKLKARFSGGGSGIKTRFIVWIYDKGSDDFWIAADVDGCEQSEVKLVAYGAESGLLISANDLTQVDETHFSPHLFSVSVHRFSKANSRYIKLLEYVTAKKYNSRDGGEINVITPEMGRIRQVLDSVYGSKGLSLLKMK